MGFYRLEQWKNEISAFERGAIFELLAKAKFRARIVRFASIGTGFIANVRVANARREGMVGPFTILQR
jgi:hypothetical protein